MLIRLEAFLNEKRISFQRNFDTARLSYIRAGGIAKLVTFPDSEDKLIILLNYLIKNNIKYKLLGRCSNTVFSDTGYYGVIILTSSLREFTFNGDSITLGCGVFFKNMAISLMREGISVLPQLYGIPASIGGMVRNNAGAFGREIKDCFISARLYCLDSLRFLTLSREEMAFGYRCSMQDIFSLSCLLLLHCMRLHTYDL